MKRIVLSCLFLISTLGWAAEPKPGLLPKVFAGWQLQNSQIVTEAAKADPSYAELLKEYGFAEMQTAQYSKPGRTMTVKAIRFSDASGGFGAYSFYRAPEMAPEEIGDRAASNNERVLFNRGNMLVDIRLDKVTATSAGELRELAANLPTATGSAANLPPVLNYLPKPAMIENSVKYVTGPVALAKLDSPITAQIVDFSTRAEIADAQYKSSEGDANLMLIYYPTPAVAGARLREIESFHPAVANGNAAPAIYSKRTGPLVAIVTGRIPSGEAKTLLASVNYEADVTWNQNTHYDKRDNLGYLLVNVVMLVTIIFGLAILAGVLFGGSRVIFQKWLPNRFVGRSEDADIIRLDIGK